MLRNRPLSLCCRSLIIALALAACGSMSEGSSLPADIRVVPGASTLGFQAFQPDTLSVALGGQPSVVVSWRNDDALAHTVTDTAAVPTFNSGAFAGGDTVRIAFLAAGSYGYRCSIHNGMQGLIVVAP